MAIAFVEPSVEKKQHIMSQMHSVSSLPPDQQEDFEEVIRQLRMELDSKVRAKTNRIPFSRDYGQHHFFGIRSLNDPKEDIGMANAQLAGEEFFGVNRFVDELLDVADIQWWTIYEGSGWSMHERCVEGEHQECWGSWGDLKSAVIMVNGVPLSVDETFSFYRTMMNRGKGKFTEKFQRATIEDAVERVSKGGYVDKVSMQLLESLGLCDGTDLTYAGRSLLEEQLAKERKKVEQGLQVALDHHGLTRDRKLGPHGGLFEIANYLKVNGIKAILDKPTLTESEYRGLKAKDNAFVKKFGFSFLNEAMIAMYTIDDIQNEFIRKLGEDVLPAVIKGGDLEATVLEAYKQKHGSKFDEKITGIVESSISDSAYDSLAACVESIERAVDEFGTFSRANIEIAIKSGLREKAKLFFESDKLEDKYNLVDMLDCFAGYVKFGNGKKKKLADDILSMFKKEYKGFQNDQRVEFVRKFISGTESLKMISLDNIVDFVFEDVCDPDSLKTAIGLLASVDQITDPNHYQRPIKAYFENILNGKTILEKINICLPYLDCLQSHSWTTPSQVIPQEIARLGNLKDLEFVSKLCSNKIDGLVDFYSKVDDKAIGKLVDKMGPNVTNSHVVFIDLFKKLDDAEFKKLLDHFGVKSGYSIKQTKSGIKIKNIYSSKHDRLVDFLKAAMFCSYIAALEKDPNTQFDPKKQYGTVIDTKILTYKFGKAKPQPESESDFKLEYSNEKIDDIFADSGRKKKESRRKKGGLYSLLEEYSIKEDNDLYTPKIYNKIKEDKYLNLNNYIIDNKKFKL